MFVIMFMLPSPQSGLERRGYKEVGFLREVDEVVRTGNAIQLPLVTDHILALLPPINCSVSEYPN